MRTYAAALAAALLSLAASACDGTGNADGARGRCAAGGQILGDCGPVETPADACWKLVSCAVVPVRSDSGQPDWGACLDRIERLDPTSAQIAVDCIGTASCDQLAVNDGPQNPYEWPDCLEYP